ncbi:ABA4-like family protein [Streptomyces sp. NPDC020965]|uniref:ABA4-like family protein n=1 Tax=Streptomyces sp. NPDC020965 TaxID=3365105 RepID=UPI0037A0578C
MTDFLFALAFWLAAPIWLALIAAPTRPLTARIAASPLTVLPILLVYTALAVPAFPELWTLVTAPDLDKLRDLVAVADGAGAIWAQVIAWDLLIGQWMFLEARRLRITPWVMSPLLFLTILLSPFGLLIFLALRAARIRRSAAADAWDPAGHPDPLQEPRPTADA